LVFTFKEGVEATMTKGLLPAEIRVDPRSKVVERRSLKTKK